LRQACRFARRRHAVGFRQPVALTVAIDCRIFDLPRGARGQRLVDLPGIGIERARIEIDVLKTERFRHDGADRARIIERRGLDGAERRSDQVPARGIAALVGDKCGDILIPDRSRHQRGAEGAEPEARRIRRADDPDTRRHHYPHTHTQRVRCYGNATAVARMRQVYLLSS